MKLTCTTALLALAATSALAEETRSANAHVHGIAEMRVALDGTTLEIAFEAPGADIVGFEYEATTDEDRAAIETAIETLTDPANVLTLPDAAACTLVAAEAELEGHGDHAHDDHHDDHDHDANHDHEHDAHDHADHADEGGGHSAFHAEYRFDCADPAALDRIALPYFAAFPNAGTVSAEYVTAIGAGAATATTDTPEIALE